MRYMNPLLTALFVALLLCAPYVASAECPQSLDFVLNFPYDGDSDIPTNVVPRIELPVGEVSGVAPVWTVNVQHGDDVAGETYWDGLTATFTPWSPLEPNETYSVDVSLHTGIHGSETYRSFSFTTGDGPDDRRPRFDGVESISWEYKTAEWLQSNCNLYRGGGHLFTLTLGDITDETDDYELFYHVYRSAGPDLSGPRLEARMRRDDDTFLLFVPEGAGDGEYCFHAEVQDLTGRFDTNTSEVCLDVIANSLFGNICSVTAPAPRSSAGGLLLSAGLGLLVVMRRIKRSWG